MSGLVLVAAVVFAWGAFGVAVATWFWAVDHVPDGVGCRPPLREFVQFGALVWMWPVLVPFLLFRGVWRLCGGGRGGREVGGGGSVSVRVVSVGSSSDGVSNGSGVVRVFK